MKTISTAAAMLALSICIASPAMAQGRHQQERAEQAQAGRQGQRIEQRRVFTTNDRQARRDDRRDHRADRRNDRRDDRWDRRSDRREDRWDRRNDRRDARIDRRNDHRPAAGGRPFYGPSYSAPRAVYRGQRGWRGAGPNHNFYRGARLPPQYRSHYYVVDNWRAHRLSPPPRGYHWVQTGPDYVLVAIATGIILQIFLGG